MGEERLFHRIVLEERKKLTMTGVTEVVSFEEDGVVLKTSMGMLVIQGRGLKLRTLAPDGGQVEVAGTVTGLFYEEQRQRGGWFRRAMS